ncbi:MAG TPA: PD-(D/E)XK nuclease family protein [Solirubrobacteraceae bacterium]|jgi:CRISPR/Cas system-associated exonuclease Cas4 (RecB family)|nr:PD-(D/E)XK nuclease family protein [Solirubrobacteraceae bacterium]
MTLPKALALNSVSPSRLKDLAECPLRVAFKQHAEKSAAKADAQIIGDSLHVALAECIRLGELVGEDAAWLVEERFVGELERQAPGREVRGVRVAVARLRRIVARILELTSEAGPGAVTLSEEALNAREGAIHGVVDLIIDSERLHVIVDYKTGRTVDEDGEVIPHFQVQLQLYAVLEHDRSGRWPESGVLLRFGGPPVSVSIESGTCERVADEAVESLVGYQALTGTVPPANAGEVTCRFCSFAPQCPAFWEAISPSWTRGAVRGRVARAESSAAGGLTVWLEEASGSHDGTVVIRRLSDAGLDVDALPVGAQLVVCGVHPDADGRLLPDRSAQVALQNS